MQVPLIQPEICHAIHCHVNMILKLMVKLVTDLVVEIVYFFTEISKLAFK